MPTRRPFYSTHDVTNLTQYGESEAVLSSFPPPPTPQGAYKSSTICYCPEKGTWTELEGEVAEPLAGPACSTVVLPACLPFNK